MSIPYGYCQCGCGEKTNLAAFNSAFEGKVKGQPMSFLRGHNRRGAHNPTPIEFRLINNIVLDESCWQWTGIVSNSGYGKVSVNDKSRYAHRVAYETFVAAIPDGLEIDHLCNNKVCINPEHLEAVTHAENQRRMFRRGVVPAQSRKTHCVNGHPFDRENTFVRSDGHRGCKACEKVRSMRYERKRRRSNV